MDGEEINCVVAYVLKIWDHTKRHGLTNQIVMLSSLKIIIFGTVVIEKKAIIFYIIVVLSFSIIDVL